MFFRTKNLVKNETKKTLVNSSFITNLNYMKNKGGAPRKNEQSKLKNRITLSFNEPEFDMLTEKGITDAKTLKTIVLNSLAGKKIELNTNKDPKFIYELNKIGVNLNQLTMNFKIYDQLPDNDLRNLYSLIDKLEKLLTL